MYWIQTVRIVSVLDCQSGPIQATLARERIRAKDPRSQDLEVCFNIIEWAMQQWSDLLIIWKLVLVQATNKYKPHWSIHVNTEVTEQNNTCTWCTYWPKHVIRSNMYNTLILHSNTYHYNQCTPVLMAEDTNTYQLYIPIHKIQAYTRNTNQYTIHMNTCNTH